MLFKNLIIFIRINSWLYHACVKAVI